MRIQPKRTYRLMAQGEAVEPLTQRERRLEILLAALFAVLAAAFGAM